MGNFVITKRKDGQFQFNLKATNGQVILTSEAYSTKANCLNGVESVRKNAIDNTKYNRLISADHKPYFTLIAANAQVIGTSQMYQNEASRELGIESVKANAPGATVEDQTLVVA